MSGECEKCNEHALECVCKKKPFKPNCLEVCPLCEGKLYISSIIPENGQVNFGCLNIECPVIGFINKAKLYFGS